MDIDISKLSSGLDFVPAAAVTAAAGSQEQASPEAEDRKSRQHDLAARASVEEAAAEQPIAEEEAVPTIDQPQHRVDSLA